MRIREAIDRIREGIRKGSDDERDAVLARLEPVMREALKDAGPSVHIVAFVVDLGASGGYTIASSLSSEALSMDVVAQIINSYTNANEGAA